LRRGLGADICCGMLPAGNLSAAARAQDGRRRRVLRIVQTVALTVAVLCLVLHPVAPARAVTPMVQLWGLLNAKCKSGSPDDPKTQQACEKREKYSDRLKHKGCLYQEDGDWWKCPR
jgi:hypothetical protein